MNFLQSTFKCDESEKKKIEKKENQKIDDDTYGVNLFRTIFINCVIINKNCAQSENKKEIKKGDKIVRERTERSIRNSFLRTTKFHTTHDSEYFEHHPEITYSHIILVCI